MKKNCVTLSFCLVLVVVLIESSYGYPSGSPKCSATVPKHEKTKPQTGASPYKVTASAVTKKDGKSTVKVTIDSKDNTEFKGYMLYATKPNSSDKIGKFTKTDKSKTLSCSDAASAITHADEKKKKSVSLTWTAPEKFTGDVEFTAIVVKEFKEFWTDLKSSKVTVA